MGEHRGMPPPPSQAPPEPPPVEPLSDETDDPDDGRTLDDFGSYNPVFADGAHGVGSARMGLSNTIYHLDGRPSVWDLDGRAGQVLSVVLKGGGGASTDPFLEVLAANGDVLASDDNGGDGLNSFLGDVRLPTTGLYWFRTRDLANDPTGSLTLWVAADRTGADDATGSDEIIREEIGDGTIIFSGRLRAGEQRRVPFEGRRDEVAWIALESGDFDPEVSLQRPGGVEIARNDDAYSLNSRIERFPLPETGTFEVVVQSHSAGGSGRFALSISHRRD